MVRVNNLSYKILICLVKHLSTLRIVFVYNSMVSSILFYESSSRIVIKDDENYLCYSTFLQPAEDVPVLEELDTEIMDLDSDAFDAVMPVGGAAAAAAAELEEFKIVSLVKAEPYASCPTKGCNNRRLTTVGNTGGTLIDERSKGSLVCTKGCNQKFKLGEAGYHFIVKMIVSNRDKFLEITLFKGDVEQVLGRKVSGVMFDPQELEGDIKEIEGRTFRCEFVGGKVRNLVCKRALQESN